MARYFFKKTVVNNKALHIVLTILIGAFVFFNTAYELYYYTFNDQKHCSSGDLTIHLTWWSRIIGYILFFIVAYYTFKCFTGKLLISKWFSLLGLFLMCFIHYHNTYSLVIGYGGCRGVYQDHFYSSNRVANSLEEPSWSFCDSTNTLDEMKGWSYGYEVKNNTLIIYRIKEDKVQVSLPILFWQFENNVFAKDNSDSKRRLQEAKTVLRTCIYHKYDTKEELSAD